MEKLQSIEQLELLFKATIYTLREQGVEVPSELDELGWELPDKDVTDLLGTLDILGELILSNEKYEYLKEKA